MFGLLSSLTKAVVGVATLPIDVVADAVTMGGLLTDKKRSYTGEKVSSVMENLKNAVDPDSE